MRKTILYLVLLVILGFGVWYFLFADRDIFGADEAGFNVPDTALVSKIFLADKAGKAILLERKSGGWMLDGKYPAIQQNMNNLLQALKLQTASHPVAGTAHNNVIKGLAGSSIKVEVYDNKGKQLRVFYVGGQSDAMEGTYMLVEGAHKPYVVNIPGFPGYLTPRYSTDISDWRDRTVANILPADLEKVTVQYPAEPLNNFTLTQDAAGKVAVDADPQIIKGKTFNVRRAALYTKFFQELYSEGYINGALYIDSILRTTPKRCIIDLVGRQGQKQHIEIYWMPSNKRSKNIDAPDPDVPDQYDADRFYATINDFKDTVVIQRFSFDKIFRKAWEFYAPDEEPTVQPGVDTTFSNSVRIVNPK